RVATADPHQGVEADRDVVRREEHGHHAEARDPCQERGDEDAHKVLPGMREDAAALLRVVPPDDHTYPQAADQEVEQEAAASEQEDRRPRMGVHPLELDVERAADGEEEVEVDEDADEGEEDLLDGVTAEDRRE